MQAIGQLSTDGPHDHGNHHETCRPQRHIGLLLFAIWPFTRLVHAFTAPLACLFRPYVVYRSKPAGVGSREPRRGGQRIGS